jgi:hypothetical protein
MHSVPLCLQQLHQVTRVDASRYVLHDHRLMSSWVQQLHTSVDDAGVCSGQAAHTVMSAGPGVAAIVCCQAFRECERHRNAGVFRADDPGLATAPVTGLSCLTLGIVAPAVVRHRSLFQITPRFWPSSSPRSPNCGRVCTNSAECISTPIRSVYQMTPESCSSQRTFFVRLRPPQTAALG